MYTVRQVAEMSGYTEQGIQGMIAAGRLAHTKGADGRVWIAEGDVPERRRAPSEVLVEELQREVAEAALRVEAAGANQRWGPPVRSLGLVQRTPELNELPTSQHARATWVERHGGPKGKNIRQYWKEIGEWSSIQEALEGMRRRRHQPRECENPVCGCHSALRDA